MYLASLNIDLLFKKVFSDPEIARHFFQDVLNKKITEIQPLGIEYKITDDAVIVKFDYRCKIGDEYGQVEMQQQYKGDVNKRFYLYHCVGTALQLETLKPIVVTKLDGKTYTEKNYSGVEPVISIIWMVDDTFNFTEDKVVFSTLPEATKDFITDNDLWSQPLETILAAREKTVEILNNKTKELDFFQKNKLIYLFQDNIFKNLLDKPYSKWLVLGKKSKNPNNVKSDFEEFKKDKIMAEIIRRLEKTKLEPYEFKYVSDLYHYEGMLAQTMQEVALKEQEVAQKKQELALKKQELVQKEQEVVQKEQELAQKEQEVVLQKQEVVLQKQEVVLQKQEVAQKEQEVALQKQRAEKAEEQLLKAVHAFILLGKDISYIAGILDLPIERIQGLVNQIKDRT